MSEDGLSAEAISEGLGTRFLGQNTLYHQRLTTTMDAARESALDGAPEGTVIIAEEQTAARGRLRRVWLSPRGNLALSIILYPHRQQLHSLIMVASLAVARSIEQVTGLTPEIKWPNDVLIDGRKTCGILVESSTQGDRVDYAIVGIGINVNLDLADFPEIRSIATSLSDELGTKVSRLDLVRSLLQETEYLYLAASAGNTVYEQWRNRLVTLGREVQVTTATGESTFEGTAEGVNPDGGLVLRLPDGGLVTVLAGDVSLRD